MKDEDKTTLLEKLGYGFKYTLAIIIAILAVCALCFIFISITTYFSPPLQPMFDQERLGQLGDFLGGTLNPIFGFTTVCLLLWSTFMQRNYVQKNQFNVEREFRLHQIDLAMEKIEKIYRQTINEPFKEPIKVSTCSTERVHSIAEAIIYFRDNPSDDEKNIRDLSNKWSQKNNIEEIIRQLSKLVSTLEKLVMEAKHSRKIDPIDSFWEEELQMIKKDLLSIGLDIK